MLRKYKISKYNENFNQCNFIPKSDATFKTEPVDPILYYHILSFKLQKRRYVYGNTVNQKDVKDTINMHSSEFCLFTITNAIYKFTIFYLNTLFTNWII